MGAATQLEVLFLLLYACSGARLQFRSADQSMPFVWGEHKEEHQFLQQESINVKLPSQEKPSEGALVLTSQWLFAFVPPKMPSCWPFTSDELADLPLGSYFMYRQDGIDNEQVLKRVQLWRLSRRNSPQTGQDELFVMFKGETHIGDNGHANGVQEVAYKYGKFHPMYSSDSARLPSQHYYECSYPKEAAALAVATISTRHAEPFNWELGLSGNCNRLSGCADELCKSGRKVWNVCTRIDHDFSRPIIFELIEAHLRRNDLKEPLGPAVQRAADECSAVDECAKQFEAAASQQSGVTLDSIVSSFLEGIVPKPGGKNSKSRAVFFYSHDKLFIAKRIREPEYTDGLKTIEAGGKYRLHLANQTGTTLCPTYFGFQSHGDSWIVMRAEQLSPEVQALLPRSRSNIHNFFKDVKPHPMESDRVSMLSLLGTEELQRGFSINGLAGWRNMRKAVGNDIAFLQNHDLVDYSFWVYGTLFNLAASEVEPWLSRIGETMRDERQTGCMHGCQPPPNLKPLADLTALVGEGNKVVTQSATYKCCCTEFGAGDSIKFLSPCVLVNINAKAVRTFAKNPTGCGNLVGEGKWHSYMTQKPASATRGRCLVALGVSYSRSHTVLTGKTAFSSMASGWHPHLLAPEDLGISVPKPPQQPHRCGVVCVSIGDYFLHFGSWEKFENKALVLWYGSQKWSEYPKKMDRVLLGLGNLLNHHDDLMDGLGIGPYGGDANALAKRIVYSSGELIGKTQSLS